MKLPHAQVFKKFFQDNRYLFLAVLLSLPAVFSLFRPGYTSMHDDIQVMRLFEMGKCFRHLQLPCRWVPDMGAEYGHPLFNFHPVLPYYLGAFFKLSGLSYIWSAKLLFALSLVLGAGFMYLLAAALFSPLIGVGAAVLFTYAPYHAVDVYVRGALTEAWGLMFFPLIFYSLYRFIKQPGRWSLLLSVLALTGLFLSHNIMALLFTPLAGLWSLFWLYQTGRWKLLKELFFILLLSVGLGAFFLLPAFFEKELLNFVSVQGYFNFADHFVSPYQLLGRYNWGYGPSHEAFDDDISFHLGLPHLLIALASLWLLVRKKIVGAKRGLLWFVMAGFLFAAFMTLGVSEFIWRLLPIFIFVQFPWRFLGLSIFFSSLLLGVLVGASSSRQRFWVGLVIVLSIGLNFSFFRPQFFYPGATDESKLAGNEYFVQSFNPLLDYHPKTVVRMPAELAPNSPWSEDAQTVVSDYVKASHRWQFNVSAQQESVVFVPIFEFPRWEVRLDGELIDYQVANPEGIIVVRLPEGEHQVSGELKNTPVRTLANGLSLLSLLVLVAVVIRPPRISYTKNP